MSRLCVFYRGIAFISFLLCVVSFFSGTIFEILPPGKTNFPVFRSTFVIKYATP